MNTFLNPPFSRYEASLRSSSSSVAVEEAAGDVVQLVTLRYRIPGCAAPPPRSLPVYSLRGFSGCCLVCAAHLLTEPLLSGLGRRVSPTSGYTPEVSLVKTSPRTPGSLPGVGGPVSALVNAVSLAQDDRNPSVLLGSPVCVGTTGGDNHSHFAVCLVCSCPGSTCFISRHPGGSGGGGSLAGNRHARYLNSLLGFQGLIESSGITQPIRARNGSSFVKGPGPSGIGGALWYAPTHPWSPHYWV